MAKYRATFMDPNCDEDKTIEFDKFEIKHGGILVFSGFEGEPEETLHLVKVGDWANVVIEPLGD